MHEVVIQKISKNKVVVSGYASTFDVPDQERDIFLPGAFSQSIEENNLGKRNIKFLWQHNQMEPIGVINSLVEDYYGLRVEAEINNETQTGREAISLIKQGAVGSFSIAFDVEKSYEEENYRKIQKVFLYEISVVTFPANQGARIESLTERCPPVDRKEGITSKLEEIERLINQII